MIYHFPYGTNANQSCGYDRSPLYPSEGEAISVRCIPPKEHENPRLFLVADGSRSALKGEPDNTVASGCFLFNLGSFKAGTQVEYSFSFDEKTVYGFSVRSFTYVTDCRELLETGSGLKALCSLNNGGRLALHFVPDGEGFRLDVTSGEGSIQDGKGEGVSQEGTVEEGRIAAPNGCSILVKRQPFSVTALSPDQEPLLSFENGKHPVAFSLEEGRIRSFSLSLDGVGKGFYGCGEKFDRVNQRGLSPRNVVYEQYTQQGRHAYLPVPWLFTEGGWGLFSASECETQFDLTGGSDEKTQLVFSGEVDSESFSSLHLILGPPKVQLRELHRLTGPCRMPPSWAFGPWMSANGWATQAEAQEQIRKMTELDIPATVMVLEAWSDEATFYIWNGAKYTPQKGKAFSYKDFSFNPDGPWPDPKAFVQDLHKAGLHLVLWQIPVLKSALEADDPQHKLDKEEAVEKGYCVKNPDGTPYRIPDRWFSNSLLLDFTNPQAVDWWFQKRRYLRDELHVEGFKTDGGEFVYDPETVFYNGKTGHTMRNRYPADYTQAYYDFIQGGEKPGILFSRAGFSGSQSRPMHWAGDQLSTFGELKSQLIAGLSAGLSGIPFWGFDLGGFAGELPSTELYLRAAAMAVFSPVMQFHSEPRSGQYGDSRRRDWINDRSPWNLARINQAPEIIEVYRKLAKLRMKLMPYILKEAAWCAESGRPMLCHLMYDYPENEEVIDLEDEYFFGRDLLVAPVIEEGAYERRFYLPAGQWTDFWTGERIGGDCWHKASCLPGQIIVFSRDGKLLAETL